MAHTHLLIDADIICYQVAASNEVEVQFDEDTFAVHSDLRKAKHDYQDAIHQIKERVGVEEVLLCYTASNNFRKQILTSYKENRAGTRKPCGYKAIKLWSMDQYKSMEVNTLEGDDLLGILGTRDPEHTIIYSADKDIKTIPGTIWDMDLNIPVKQSLDVADWYHMHQTLTGDSTDNYKGCHGIGKVKADKLLGEPGERPIEELWPIVREAFEQMDDGESAALVQARVAFILRDSHFNTKTKEVLHWEPPQIS